MAHLKNKLNEYADRINQVDANLAVRDGCTGGLYDLIPKSVWAALAISAYAIADPSYHSDGTPYAGNEIPVYGSDQDLQHLVGRILARWHTLHNAKIVPQAPPTNAVRQAVRQAIALAQDAGE